ncbi:MAG: hypothetical protein LBD23_12980 [Oscillospiraceae bacterium]|jgi:hypothetical protein|nr:hypothetical protein [Oscillospiraceae bacterium]
MNIIDKFGDNINGVLETFDRLLINGYFLQLFGYSSFGYYLHANGVKLKDFDGFAKFQTNSLCNHIEGYIKENEVKLEYLQSGKADKDKIARDALSQNPKKIGLVAAFSAVELCNTMTVKLNPETKKLEPVSRKTKCKHYYLYYNDDEFGWMFFKIQTWLPYNVQIYINGREYLSRLLEKNGTEYVMYSNSFAHIDDFSIAQELADGILNKRLLDSFGGIASKVNNLLPDIKKVFPDGYYWCIDQCEFATDINFKNREELERVYKTLVETAFFTFSSQDVYSFFGRKIEHIQKLSNGEIVSDLRRRYQGYRIKFRLNSNQVKMYDKGNNLRIEVTINNPKDFKIIKSVTDDVTGEVIGKKWTPMGKSVANLYRYAEISRAIIKRFIHALPEVDADRLPVKAVNAISSRKEVDGRPYSAFNVLNADTIDLFAALSNGAYLINGFDNKLLRRKLFNDPDSKSCINKTTRIIGKLRAHGIIKKVPKKHRYYVTSNGRIIIHSILLYTNRTLLCTG